MSTLGKAVIEFSTDTAKFTGDVGRAAVMFERNMRTMRTAVTSLMQAVGAGIGIAAIQQMVQQTIDAGDQLYKMSQKTGISVEELSTLKYAAELSGSSLEGLEKGIKKLSTSMVEATDSTSKSGKVMKALGVDITGGTLPTLEKLADTFALLPDGSTKSALAVELFGRAGLDLIPMLNQGRAGIAALRDEAERLWLKMSTDTAKAAEAFNDNMRAVKMSSTGAAQALLNSAAPALVRMSEAAKAAAIESGLLGAAWVILGGIAAEAIGLNDGDAQKIAKRLRVVNDELSKFGKVLGEERKQALLEGTVKAVNATEGAFLRAKFQAQGLFNLLEAMSGKFEDQNDRRARKRPDLGALAATEKERVAMEKKLRDALSTNDKAEREAAAATLQYENAMSGLNKQISQFNHEGPLALMVIETETGSLKKQSPERKKNLLERASELRALQLDVMRRTDVIARINDETAARRALDEAVQRHMIGEEKNIRDQKFEVSLIGVPSAERELLTAMRRIDDAAQATLATLDPSKDEGAYADSVRQLDEFTKMAKASAAEVIRSRRAAESDWVTSAKLSLKEYADAASNTAESVAQLVSNSFKTMEDALVEFAKTGKLNFRSLADSIVSDLIRIQIRSQITGPLAKAMEQDGGLWGLLQKAGGSLFGGGGGMPSGAYDLASGAPLGAYAEGTGYVPQTGMYQLHQGEAVIPAGGNRAIIINMNISTPDVSSFRASRAQLSADMAMALASASRRGT